jgi:hypothetical protein
LFRLSPTAAFTKVAFARAHAYALLGAVANRMKNQRDQMVCTRPLSLTLSLTLSFTHPLSSISLTFSLTLSLSVCLSLHCFVLTTCQFNFPPFPFLVCTNFYPPPITTENVGELKKLNFFLIKNENATK